MSNRLIRLIASLVLASSAAVWAQAPSIDGEVRKIDKAQQKITLKHGEIQNIQMPAMTMVFRVKDAKMLDSVEVGDHVKFSADKLDGQFTVTALQKAR